MSYQIITGDCLETLRTLPDNSVDSLVTDPPAGIAFMGKDWDSDKGGRNQWIAWMRDVMSECLRVMKPGAHGLVWAIPRTSHWTATALEDAGFEIRDRVSHLFGSGFPKSHSISKALDKAAGAEREVAGVNQDFLRKNPISDFKTKGTEYNSGYKDGENAALITIPSTPEAKQWDGWGTALKPSVEDWWLIRKPLSEKTVASNVMKHGCGGINIDGCRVAAGPDHAKNCNRDGGKRPGFLNSSTLHSRAHNQGRFPSHLVLSHNEECEENCSEGCAVAELDKQSGDLHNSFRSSGPIPYNDSGGASRFFYCAKASKSDKNAGCDLNQRKSIGNRPNSGDSTGKFPDHDQRERVGNHHPTVKSTKLMSYLIRLITPPGGVVIDPFTGSGSTGVSALREGFSFIGIEQNPEYSEIATRRLQYEISRRVEVTG